MLELAHKIKKIVDNTKEYPNWNDREDIKAKYYCKITSI